MKKYLGLAALVAAFLFSGCADGPANETCQTKGYITTYRTTEECIPEGKYGEDCTTTTYPVLTPIIVCTTPTPKEGAKP